MADKGYAGRISNSGSQVVQAPAQIKGKKGQSVVKRGSDLRSGSTGGKGK